MAKPKHDYDSEEFYQEIFGYAMQGATDAEIADNLDLDPEAFSTMKNGKYIAWNEEQNARRSERILKVLARGRRKVNSVVRGRFLKAALGGIKTKNVAKLKRPVLDENGFPTKDENGKPITEVVQINETEFESPPNIQALSVWLYHHDPEWRKIQRGEDADASDIPTDIQQGISIDDWIKQEVSTKAESNGSEMTEGE